MTFGSKRDLKVCIKHDRDHMSSHGGGTNGGGGGQIQREDHGFWGSGRSRAAGRPFKMVGGFAPHLFLRVSRPPGAAQTPQIQDFPS